MITDCKFSAIGWLVRYIATTLAMLVLVVSPAWAQDCNPDAEITKSPSPYFVGSVVTVNFQVGAGVVTGGALNTMTIENFRFALDCVDDGPLSTCVDDGTAIAYVGDASITENCAGAVASDLAAGGDTPNVVEFTFTPALVVGSGETCTVSFDVEIQSLGSADTNGADRLDGAAEYTGNCDNGLDASAQPTTAYIVQECSVEIDKQVSCDGGTNWDDDAGDDDPDNANTNGCVGNVGDTIMTRFIVNNTGSDVTCDVNDTTFGSVEDGTVFPGGTTTIDAADGECDDGDTNTASLAECFCVDGAGDSIPATTGPDDTARHECCGVLIDKQITCNEAFPSGSATADDNGLVSMNEDGTDGCSAVTDSLVSLVEQINNNGSANLLDCAFSDVNGGGPLCTILGQEGGDGPTIAPGQDLLPECADQTCTEDFENDEPNTATVTCTCEQFEGSQRGPETVSAFDTAEADCISPGLEISKTCEESATTAGEHDITVTIENTGDVDLENCAIVDILHTDADGVTCAEVPPDADTTTDITGDIGCTSNGTILLATGGGPQEVCSGSIASPLFSACNTATVECDVVGTEGTVTVDAGPAEADCPVTPGGCFTRTPGYWAQHPESIDQVLNGNAGLGGTLPGSGGSIDVCGLSLTEAFSTPGDNNDPPFDFPQDLCSIGNDKNALGTSPQQMQLIRECAAAALNIDVSAQGELSCDGAFPGIAGVFNACCNELCPSGASPDTINNNDQEINGVTMLSCIGALDAFNNADFEDDDFEDVGLINMAANPSECQEAHNDGDANDQNENNGRLYGPKK